MPVTGVVLFGCLLDDDRLLDLERIDVDWEIVGLRVSAWRDCLLDSERANGDALEVDLAIAVLVTSLV
jgi:hypothetical protein